jgi:integrase
LRKKHRRTVMVGDDRLDRSFATKADADEWYTSMKRKVDRAKAGLPMALDKTPFSSYCARWIQLRIKKSDGWKIEESRLRKHILPLLGNHSMRFISRHDIESALHDIRIENALSEATFNRYRTLVHKIFEDACRDGLREDNPVKRVDKYPENFEPTEANDAEIAAFLTEAMKSAVPGFLSFVATGMNCGARPGELIALRWSDLRPAMNLIHVSRRFVRATGEVRRGTKSRKAKNTRFVPLNTMLATHLAGLRLRTLFSKDEDYIFQKADGSMASINVFNKEYARIRKACGIRGSIRLYDLTRHAFASRLAERGNMRLVQAVLGHSDGKTTERYAHHDPSFAARSADVEVGGAVVKLN